MKFPIAAATRLHRRVGNGNRSFVGAVEVAAEVEGLDEALQPSAFLERSAAERASVTDFPSDVGMLATDAFQRQGQNQTQQIHPHEHGHAPAPVDTLDDLAAAPEEVAEEVTEELKELEKTDPLEATEDASEEESGSHHHHNENYKALLFFFGALVIGLAILVVLERAFPGIPYTCALFIAGSLVTLFHYYNKSHNAAFAWPTWFDAMELWSAIDPHTLFFCFLPALLFSEAMKLNVQLVKECFWQVFLLACPGVLFGTVMVAAVAHYLLPYGWDWPIALVFGSIVSATDPVAVVALFNTLGVSPRLTMLVSGESLLNDGTAIVVFTLTLRLAMGVSLSSWTVVAFFGHMTLVSAVLGFSISLVAVLVIRRCAEEHYKHDMMVQVITTICTAYLSFFIAESEVSTSGVITTVTAGFVIAYCAWPSFVSSHTMHTVWETIEFVGNTVIFFLAGMKFMDVVMERSDKIGLADWGWLLALYVILTVIRALMVAVLWKPLNAMGHPITFKEALVIVWSGLRGAVSLSLALIVDLGPIGNHVGPYVVFHVGGITALTFLINAATSSTLLTFLGLTKTKESRERIIAQFSIATARGIQGTFEENLTSAQFKGAEASLVRSMVPALSEDVHNAWSPRHAFGTERSATGTGAIDEDDIRSVYRQVLLRLVKYYYHKEIEAGLIPRNLDMCRHLLQATEKAESETDKHLRDWDEIQVALGVTLPAAFLTPIQRAIDVPPLCWVVELRRQFGAHSIMLQKVFGSILYREAHHHARLQLPKYFDIGDAISCRLQGEVIVESKAQCDKAKAYLEEELSGQPKDFVALAKSELLARHLLQQQEKSISQMQEMGLFTDAEADDLLQEVNSARRELFQA